MPTDYQIVGREYPLMDFICDVQFPTEEMCSVKWINQHIMSKYKYRFISIKYFSQHMGSLENYTGNITRIFPSFSRVMFSRLMR